MTNPCEDFSKQLSIQSLINDGRLDGNGNMINNIIIEDDECLTISEGDTLIIKYGFVNQGRIINNGTITILYNGGVLYISPEKEITNNGTITMMGATPGLQVSKIENMGTIKNYDILTKICKCDSHHTKEYIIYFQKKSKMYSYEFKKRY